MKQLMFAFTFLFLCLCSQAQDIQMPAFSSPSCDALEEKQAREKCQIDAMNDYIISHLNYPKSAYEKGIEGTVVIQFKVEKDGSISDATIAQDLEEGCGKEALRIVQSFPNWHPGIQDGKVVAVKIAIPITFSKVGWKATKN